IIEKIQGFLKNGGILCALSRYIENVKVIFDQLKQNRYYLINSSELIKREIKFDKEFLTTKSVIQESEGYLTFGRKVNDTAIIPEKKIEGPQFVETLLDVGLNFKDSLPKEEEKIDYSNLRE
ncbi:MAG: hypothetical protein ACTSXK_12365, partial [Promethearchaeota archaeon]